jgi:hypothetical protein
MIKKPCQFQLSLLEFLGDGGNLLDAILVGGQVTLEGFVLLFQGFQFGQAARAEVLRAHTANI